VLTYTILDGRILPLLILSTTINVDIFTDENMCDQVNDEATYLKLVK